MNIVCHHKPTNQKHRTKKIPFLRKSFEKEANEKNDVEIEEQRKRSMKMNYKYRRSTIFFGEHGQQKNYFLNTLVPTPAASP